jgi:DNA polymerase
MDARELLKRYIEQRRESGENELVLDSLSVEEVLRILGAPSLPERSEAPASSDWRAALIAGGVAPKGADPSVAALPRDDQKEKGHRFEKPADSTEVAEPPQGIIIGAETRPAFDPIAQLATLDDIAKTVAGCRRCPLYATATNPVPGEGNPNARLVCVGEAPGENEDQEGRPFVGASGQLLTKILAAIDLKRDEVFICNVLKHRPPANRNPEPNEVAACSPYLVRQIEIIKPSVILAFGKFAAQTLLKSDLALSRLRTQIHRYHGVPLIVTYHPAALLRNPSWKRATWEDVQLARRILDRSAGATPNG